ncbi:MAG: hypothetical protein LBQ50_03015 [Planctomycetaceae bacterium]|jgi:hypothetical protein|nr:hypothetical protein [Planctomycetaceae bacterium]
MITFTCLCGKKYQLPDRHAGREVRCNQCGNPLIVPHQSQAEPTEVLPQQMDQPHVASQELASQQEIPQQEIAQWGHVPVPNGEKNEQSPIVSGWSTGPYQKKSSCILTIVLVLLGAGVSFFAGFLAGSLLRSAVPTHHHDFSEYGNEEIADEEIEVSEIHEFSAADWNINDEDSLVRFAVQTADAKPIRISLDKNPVVGKTKGALDDIAEALKTDEKPKEVQEHNRSLQIYSESGTEFRFVFPSQGSANLDAGKFREIHFGLYVPDQANAPFKPEKPEGIDKVLVLSKLSLRLVADGGFVEFVPENAEKFVSILERAKSDWVSVQIPLSGNEFWKRVDHGIFGSLTVQRIELHAQPTGNGATLWIDNLKIINE